MDSYTIKIAMERKQNKNFIFPLIFLELEKMNRKQEFVQKCNYVFQILGKPK